MRWLFFHRQEGGTAKAFDAAAANGHVHVLDWLRENTGLRPEGLREGGPLCPSVLAGAAAKGHLGVIRFDLVMVMIAYAAARGLAPPLIFVPFRDF